jgi:transposase
MYLDGRRKEIIRWVEQGLNDREIADRCRVSRSTVRYWRERNGIERPVKTDASQNNQQAIQPKPTLASESTIRDGFDDEDAAITLRQ